MLLDITNEVMAQRRDLDSLAFRKCLSNVHMHGSANDTVKSRWKRSLKTRHIP